MRKTFSALMIGIMLSGCQTTPLTALSYADEQQMIRQILARCRSLGIKDETPEQKSCFAQEVRAEQYRRNQNIATRQQAHQIFNAMAASGASQQNPAFSPVYTGPQQVIIQTPPPTLSQTVRMSQRPVY